MKKILLLIILAMGLSAAKAQTLSPVVISSSGGFYSNASALLSFTVGEMTMVETFSTGSNILTQGFQQAFDFGVFIEEHKDMPFAYAVFPNPGNGNFNLAVESKHALHAQAIVYDAIGKVVLRKEFAIGAGSQIIPLSLEACSEGMYHLDLITTNDANGNQQHLSQKIQKNN